MKSKRLIALLASAALLLSGCSSLSKKKELTYTDTLFDTVISVQILDPAEESILNGCKKLCQKYDLMFSSYNEESEISKINSAGGAPVEVSPETAALIKRESIIASFPAVPLTSPLAPYPNYGTSNPGSTSYRMLVRSPKLYLM